MIPVSRQVKSAMTRAIGDSNFLMGIQKDIDLAQAIEQGMSTMFGAAIFQALEEIETAAYTKMANTSPWRIHVQMAARAEMRVAQYIKARISSRITNSEALIANLEELGQEGQYD